MSKLMLGFGIVTLIVVALCYVMPARNFEKKGLIILGTALGLGWINSAVTHANPLTLANIPLSLILDVVIYMTAWTMMVVRFNFPIFVVVASSTMTTGLWISRVIGIGDSWISQYQYALVNNLVYLVILISVASLASEFYIAKRLGWRSQQPVNYFRDARIRNELASQSRRGNRSPTTWREFELSRGERPDRGGQSS